MIPIKAINYTLTLPYITHIYNLLNLCSSYQNYAFNETMSEIVRNCVCIIKKLLQNLPKKTKQTGNLISIKFLALLNEIYIE